MTEYTNATTTQLIDARTGDWDRELLERLGLPANLLTEVVAAGTDLGPLLPEVAEEVALAGVRVVAPATHDTGSAVVGAPLAEGWAYISSGTWSLVGVERDRPLLGVPAERQNLSNEGGAFGTTRLLKNVMGLWILESCRREWQAQGLEVGFERLLGEVGAIEDGAALLFPDDPRFFNPKSMLAAIAAQLAETGQEMPENPARVTKLVLDSLALRYASVLRTIESLTLGKLRGVQIVGGGSQNSYLNQATATCRGPARPRGARGGHGHGQRSRPGHRGGTLRLPGGGPPARGRPPPPAGDRTATGRSPRGEGASLRRSRIALSGAGGPLR